MTYNVAYYPGSTWRRDKRRDTVVSGKTQVVMGREKTKLLQCWPSCIWKRRGSAHRKGRGNKGYTTLEKGERKLLGKEENSSRGSLQRGTWIRSSMSTDTRMRVKEIWSQCLTYAKLLDKKQRNNKRKTQNVWDLAYGIAGSERNRSKRIEFWMIRRIKRGYRTRTTSIKWNEKSLDPWELVWASALIDF